MGASWTILGLIAGSVTAVAAVAVGVAVLLSSGPLVEGEQDEGRQPPAQAADLPVALSVVRTVAGERHKPTGGPDHLDGVAAEARFSDPSAVAVSADGTVFVADFENRRIRKIAPDGQVSTLAGSGKLGVDDGPGEMATFAGPAALVLGPDGNLYVSDSPGHRIRKVAPDGTVTTLAGGGAIGVAVGESRDGDLTTARFNRPAGLTFLPSGTLLVAEVNRIRAISPDGVVSTWLGDGSHESVDGPIDSAKTWYPAGLAVAPDGTVWFTELGANAVRRIKDGHVQTVLASGRPFTSEGTSSGSMLAYPSGIAVLRGGEIAIANTQRHEILLLRTDGTVARLAGGAGPDWVDGPGDEARFAMPTGLVSDGGSSIYVADTGNNVIRQVTLR